MDKQLTFVQKLEELLPSVSNEGVLLKRLPEELKNLMAFPPAAAMLP